MPFQPLPPGDLEHVLRHTALLWEEVRGRRLFLTGGTGFFGRWLVESFHHACTQLGLGAELTVLTRDVAAAQASYAHLAETTAVKFVPGDVRDFVFPEGEFHALIHAAATSSKVVPEEEMRGTLSDGTQRVLDSARERGVRKFLFTSSGAVYGRQPPELSHVDEDHRGTWSQGEPGATYGLGKQAAEQLCLASASETLEIKIARCFAFVGPGLLIDAHFAVGNFLRDVLKGGPIEIGGDGRPWRSYLYAADLAIWLWTILFRGASGRIFNVGSDHAVTIGETAETAAQLIEPPARVKIALPPGDGPAPRYVPSTLRAQRELGLREYIPLAESLRRTFQWHQVSA